MFMANAICLVLCPPAMRATISFSLGDSWSSGFLGFGLIRQRARTRGRPGSSTFPPAATTSSAEAIWSTVWSLRMKPATPLPTTWDSVSESVIPESSSTLVPGYR